MKMKISGVIVALLSILCLPTSKAQVKTMGYKNEFFKGSTGLISVKLNKNAVAFISNDNDKAVEINCTDNSTNKKWSARVDGYMQDAHLIGKNLVVLVSTDFTFFTRANSVYKAYLIDAGSGNIIKSKMLFNGNDEYFTLPYFLVSKDKKTLTLATRETAMKRNVKVGLGVVGALYAIKKASDQGNRIKTFNVLTFDENLEPKGVISPELPDGDFVGIQKTINDDLYIAVSQNRKGITISKYLPNSEKPVKSVTEPFSYYGGLLGTEHLNDQITFMADTINNNTVYITGSFKTGDDYITMFNKYDFESNQHKRFKKSFTKSEVKELEKSFTPVNKAFKKLSLAAARDFELIKVVIHENGYFIVLTDYSTTVAGQNAPPVPYSEGILVYNLDKNMSVRAISTIPRDYLGKARSCLNVYSKGNALYILASHDNNANFIVAKINTASGKLEDMQLAEPAKAGKTDYAYLSYAILSNDNIILPILDYKLAFNKTKFDVQLYQLSW
ncbi:MAG TPA: hypothetical protein VGB63_10390 [Pedobacter sp.]|jgi:hypothetical protein